VRCGGHYGEDVAVAHELLGGSFASVRKLINLMPDAERMILISVFFFSVCLAKMIKNNHPRLILTGMMTFTYT
jgi:hypothetical protein